MKKCYLLYYWLGLLACHYASLDIVHMYTTRIADLMV